MTRLLIAVLSIVVLAASPAVALGQTAPTCHFICELAWKVEPTLTIEHLANRHRVVLPDGGTKQAKRERVFEIVLALDMESRVPRLGFTAEAIVAPFSTDNDVELEFESNFTWLTRR